VRYFPRTAFFVGLFSSSKGQDCTSLTKKPGFFQFFTGKISGNTGRMNYIKFCFEKAFTEIILTGKESENGISG
jgi:hypothetical protein